MNGYKSLLPVLLMVVLAEMSCIATIPENIPRLQGIFITTLPIALAIGFLVAGF